MSAEVLAKFSRFARRPELLLLEAGRDWFALVPAPPGPPGACSPQEAAGEAEVGRTFHKVSFFLSHRQQEAL